MLPEGAGTGLVLLVHGGGDDPSVWAEDLAEVVRAAVSTDWDVVALDWADAAADRSRAASRGRDIGEGLAPDVEAYDAVHIIAHSVGAHLGHGLVSALSEPRCQLTLLDPFVGSGLVRWEYGRMRFGAGATFAESYVNTDDGVPSSDGTLPMAHNFDVTALRPTEEDGHRWPIAVYEASVGTGVGLDLAIWRDGDREWDRYPPGELTALTEP